MAGKYRRKRYKVVTIAINRVRSLHLLRITVIFTDQSTFSLNLSRIQIRTGISVTNCHYKRGLMLTCGHNVDMFMWGRFVLSLLKWLKRAHVDWNCLFPGKISKNRLVCKNATGFAYYGSWRLLVMGSWQSTFQLIISLNAYFADKLTTIAALIHLPPLFPLAVNTLFPFTITYSVPMCAPYMW